MNARDRLILARLRRRVVPAKLLPAFLYEADGFDRHTRHGLAVSVVRERVIEPKVDRCLERVVLEALPLVARVTLDRAAKRVPTLGGSLAKHLQLAGVGQAAFDLANTFPPELFRLAHAV